MRASGVLLHISSLPSPYGIGTFGRAAYDFADILQAAGVVYWQILPLGPTGYGGSPYQSYSTFAGNPYFIDLEALVSAKLLKKGELSVLGRAKGGAVEFVLQEKHRLNALRTAFWRWSPDAGYADFCAEHAFWLGDYALYMALKEHFDGKPFFEWPAGIRNREPDALAKYGAELGDECKFWMFVQYLFFSQWMALKVYANKKGVKIIGDLPIYVAPDSADTWANRQLFQFSEDGNMTAVAGCPPDYFSPTGQLWGNPLYDWPEHEKQGYSWWISRMAHALRLSDTLRIDHFRGFDQYYAIPYGDETAENGEWEQGPGRKLFDALKSALGRQSIIAEDLGILTKSVRSLQKYTGYPGMKVLQFAFSPKEESDYLPHCHIKNCVIYTGTHDNQTLRGWHECTKRGERTKARKYLGFGKGKCHNLDFIRSAYASVADTAVIPVQDWLELGDEARMNTPSTVGGNWLWRMTAEQMANIPVGKMKEFAQLYGRMPKSISRTKSGKNGSVTHDGV